MEDDGDALSVVGDPEAVCTLAIDPERLLREHAAWINGVHVREQQDFLSPCASERRTYHLADLVGRIRESVRIGCGRLDQLDFRAESARRRVP